MADLEYQGTVAPYRQSLLNIAFYVALISGYCSYAANFYIPNGDHVRGGHCNGQSWRLFWLYLVTKTKQITIHNHSLSCFRNSSCDRQVGYLKKLQDCMIGDSI